MTHPEMDARRRARICNALMEAQDDLAAWLVARELGESLETQTRLCNELYRKLAGVFGVQEDSDVLAAITTMLMTTELPQQQAQRILTGLRAVEDHAPRSLEATGGGQ